MISPGAATSVVPVSKRLAPKSRSSSAAGALSGGVLGACGASPLAVLAWLKPSMADSATEPRSSQPRASPASRSGRYIMKNTTANPNTLLSRSETPTLGPKVIAPKSPTTASTSLKPLSAARAAAAVAVAAFRSEEHTSELQSRRDLVCRLLLEKKKEKDT